jgi:8-amino-7-oxononanoate synthase
VDVTIVTLSKAMGLMGGAACGSRVFCEGMVNFARAYIYSTQISPVIAGVVPVALEVMRKEPERQRRVRALAKRVRGELREGGVEVAGGDSPIVPVILREEKRAVEAAEELREKGLWVVPIRPPTVARGTSRLRVTLSAAHGDDEVERLIGALRAIRLG